MKIEVKNHSYNGGNIWAISGNSIYFLNSNPDYANIYCDLWNKRLVDPPNIIMEKFNAHDDKPFFI